MPNSIVRCTMWRERIILDKNLLRLQYFFASNPTQKFTHAQIRKLIKLSKITATKWINRLIDFGFIKYERVGRTYLFYTNSEDAVVRQAKIFFNVVLLYSDAKEFAEKFECEIYLFGSASRGENTEKSDIDILIIGDKVPQAAAMAEFAALEKELERKITFQIFTKLEWAKASRKDKPFYERVEKDKIRIA